MLIFWTGWTVWVAAALLVARAIWFADGGMGDRTELGPGKVAAGPVLLTPRERDPHSADALGYLGGAGQGRGEAA